eukprot:2729401-Pleurochrysis_carterae.AAC.3
MHVPTRSGQESAQVPTRGAARARAARAPASDARGGDSPRTWRTCVGTVIGKCPVGLAGVATRSASHQVAITVRRQGTGLSPSWQWGV